MDKLSICVVNTAMFSQLIVGKSTKRTAVFEIQHLFFLSFIPICFMLVGSFVKSSLLSQYSGSVYLQTV